MEPTNEPQIGLDTPVIVSGLTDPDTRKWKRVLSAADAQSESDKKKYDKFPKHYRDGILATRGADAMSANQTFPLVNTLKSLLYSQNPNIEIDARMDAGSNARELMAIVGMDPSLNTIDAVRQLFADTLSKMLEYSYDEAGSQRQNNAVLFEAIVRGLGWSKTSFDPQRGIDRCDALRRDEVYVDPHARCDVSEANYVIQTCVMPIQNAEMFFEAMGGVNMDRIKANYKLADGKGLEAEMARKNDPADEKDCFRFYECWHRDRDRRYLDYWDGMTKQHIFRRDAWPFVLDYDEYPFESLSFFQLYTQLGDAFPLLQAVDGLMTVYEEGMEYIQRHIARCRAKKIIYRADLINEDQAAKLLSGKDLDTVGVKPTDVPIDQLVKVIDWNSAIPADFALMQSIKAVTDDTVGFINEIARGGDQKELKAAHVQALGDYASAKAGVLQKPIDDWITRQVRHRAQIARQMIGSDKVERLCGPVAALAWNAGAANPEDLVAEYSIGITAGSTGEKAKRDKFERQVRLLDRYAMVNKLSPTGPVFDLTSIAQDISKLDGIRNPQKYLIPAQSEQPPEPVDKSVPINAAVASGVAALITAGLMTPEEARAKLGLPPEMIGQPAQIQAPEIEEPEEPNEPMEARE